MVEASEIIISYNILNACWPYGLHIVFRVG